MQLCTCQDSAGGQKTQNVVGVDSVSWESQLSFFWVGEEQVPSCYSYGCMLAKLFCAMPAESLKPKRWLNKIPSGLSSLSLSLSSRRMIM